VRKITIIAPALNEREHVDAFVADLAAQDFSGEIEIFVADGGSTDGTRERILESAGARGLALTIIDNPRGIVAPGLNACISAATGELIVRLDCHSRYPADYVSRCVEAAEATDAWNVGGTYEAQGRTLFERAVACALASPFGGVNWTRSSGSRSETDTVYLGAFRPIAFERAGLYDESLVRNQDDELNLRIRRAGGKVVHDPAITSTYTPRGSLRRVWKQYEEYGYWKVVVMRKHRQLTGARSLAPAGFAVHLGALASLAIVSRGARRLLVADVALYGLAATAFATRAVKQKGEPLCLVPTIVAVFPTFHLGYGSGMVLAGIQSVRRSGPFAPRGARRVD
jgi:succinoglycan biosynthesis protein ExoA